MASTEEKIVKRSASEVPGIVVKTENIPIDISLSNLIAKGDAMKYSLKQNLILKEERVKNFFQQIRVKLKSAETSLKLLAHESEALPKISATPLLRTVTNGSNTNLRRSRSLTTLYDQQNKKPKMAEVPETSLPLITPKVQPHAPSIVFRRPKKGEVIMSMQGSPLLVNSANSATTTINIPMNNGNMMSMLPELEEHPAHLPSNIDQETKGQLQTLCSHLKQFIDKLE